LTKCLTKNVSQPKGAGVVPMLTTLLLVSMEWPEWVGASRCFEWSATGPRWPRMPALASNCQFGPGHRPGLSSVATNELPSSATMSSWSYLRFGLKVPRTRKLLPVRSTSRPPAQRASLSSSSRTCRSRFASSSLSVSAMVPAMACRSIASHRQAIAASRSSPSPGRRCWPGWRSGFLWAGCRSHPTLRFSIAARGR
jgi:hypothetical protein